MSSFRDQLRALHAHPGVHVVVAGDRLPRDLADRARATGAQVSHYYGAAELSFVAWGTSEADLRPFPGAEVQVRGGVVWVRSPYLSLGYDGAEGPFTVDADGFATVGDRGSLDGGILTVAGRGAEVWIRTAAAGVEAGGTAHRLDGVPLALQAPLPGNAPTAAAVLGRLLAEVGR